MDHTVLPAITPMPASTSYAFTRWRLPRLRLRIANCSLLLIYLPRKDERLSLTVSSSYCSHFLLLLSLIIIIVLFVCLLICYFVCRRRRGRGRHGRRRCLPCCYGAAAEN